MQQSTNLRLLLAGLANGILIPPLILLLVKTDLHFLFLFMPGLFLAFFMGRALLPTHTPKHSFLNTLYWSVGLSVLIWILLIVIWNVFGISEFSDEFPMVFGALLLPMCLQFFKIHFEIKNDWLSLLTATISGASIFAIISLLPTSNLEHLVEQIKNFIGKNEAESFSTFMILLGYFGFSVIFSLNLIIAGLQKHQKPISIFLMVILLALIFDFLF